MKKKFIIVVVACCLFLSLNIGIVGVSLGENTLRDDYFEEPPIILQNPEEKNLFKNQVQIFKKESEVSNLFTDKYYADAGKPYVGKTDVPIQFDGSHSYIDPLKVEFYEWDFGDGTIGYGINPVHSYSAAGIYYTILTIKTNNGDSYQDITPVYIDQDGDHLEPYGGCFYYAEKDEPILFDASKSVIYDPDVEISKWIWHFGDGKTNYGEQVTHIYSEEKVYLVTLEIIDNNGYKRKDVLHADIGVSYSCIEDFFISSNTKLTSILNVLLNRIGSFFLYPLLFVKIYTNYNGYEETISLSSDYMFPLTIDVNHDGDGDVIVNNLNFFKPVISQSQFNDFPWFAFETTISDIEKISEDITTDDDFEIGLQFSLQIMEDFLELEEPIVRIGYHSVAGEEKPSHFTATHIFRPYILLRVLTGGATEQPVTKNTNVNPLIYHLKGKTMEQISIESSEIIKPLCRELTNKKTIETVSEFISSMDEKELQLPSQSYEKNIEGWKLITENGIRLDSSNVDFFTLLISFSNIAETTQTILKVDFESFTPTTLMHRRGKANSDLDIQGSDDSAVTLSITRKNSNGNATLGLFINPLQSFNFHIDVNRKVNGAGHISFDIDNPPENLILFVKNEDTTGSQDSFYFYLRNLPKTIEFEWLPRLDSGYIIITKDSSSDELEVGVCDDLKSPKTNLYMTNLPDTTSIDWEISKTPPQQITFFSDTSGLTVGAELRNFTQGNQTIEFLATSNEDLDIKLQWSLPDGYFELQRSTKNIDFEFFLLQDDIQLDIKGNYVGGPDDGFVFHFKDFQHGIIELVSDKSLQLDIFAKNPLTMATLTTNLEFSTGGNVKLEWNELMDINIDGYASLGLYNFTLNSPIGRVSLEEITLKGATNLELIRDEPSQFQLNGNGQISISQFEVEIGDWYSKITYANTGGGLDVLLQPKDKYYQISSDYSITLEGFDIEYDGIGDVHDMDFEIDYFDMYSEGKIWFDFSTDTPKFKFEGKDAVDVSNLHLAIGTRSTSVINFTISNAHLNSEGTIYGEWNNDYLFVDADVDFNWNIDISTLNYGSWMVNGTFEGSASMNAEWHSNSGEIDFKIGESGIFHSLEITHNNLTLNIGSFELTPGDITFQWQREQSSTNGYFNISNDGVNGKLTLFDISHNIQQNLFKLKFSDIEVESGNFYMEWSRRTSEKMIYLDNEMTIDMNLIKACWDEKTVIFGDLSLLPGEFKFTWDTVNKLITLNNGMQGLGPTLSYEDNDRKLSLSLLNLQDDYSKTMTLKWFEEQNGNISGLYVDTDDTNLVKWIEFESINYHSSGNRGRKIAINGLRANQFKVIKNDDDNLEITGWLYIANNLTYSKLVNDEWKDINIKWNLNFDGIGNIEFTADPAFNLELEISTKFSGVDIITTFDLPQYLKFGWDVDFDGNGFISIDTNNESIYEINFKIYKDTQSYQPKWGLYIGAAGLKAEDYNISWDFSLPPGQWILIETGYIEPSSINDIHLAWNGKWFDLLTGGTPI